MSWKFVMEMLLLLCVKNLNWWPIQNKILKTDFFIILIVSECTFRWLKFHVFWNLDKFMFFYVKFTWQRHPNLKNCCRFRRECFSPFSLRSQKLLYCSIEFTKFHVLEINKCRAIRFWKKIFRTFCWASAAIVTNISIIMSF